MKWVTEIPFYEHESSLDYDSSMALFGSCFVQHIGNKLDDYRFNTLQNPFGILFQPKAIETLINRALNAAYFSENDLHEHNDLWFNFETHSMFNQPSKEALLNQLNAILKTTANYLAKASHLVITLGTAWVYKHNALNKTVANCHKLPQSAFVKQLLTVEEIKKALQNVVNPLLDVNPELQILFTVSPVRHIKDGILKNSRSKAHLLTAIHDLINSAKTDRIAYFPAYEIMVDELRDYRFYGPDLIHPNSVAIAYIWERFKKSWISPSTYKIMDEVKFIQQQIDHKPTHPKSTSHKVFQEKLHNRILDFNSRNPNIKPISLSNSEE